MCFAHNGDCPKFQQNPQAGQQQKTLLLGRTTLDNIMYHPVGDTDSETVFCAILNALNAEFPGNQLPSLPVLHEFLSTLCDEIIQGDGQEETIFNFLLGCGQYTLFAFSWPGRRPGSNVWNGLHYLIREPPFSIAKLVDDDYSIDFAKMTTCNDRVAVIATKPLTGETGWREMARGELIMFDKGKAYRTPKCCEIVEQEGRGLTCRWFAEKCHSWRGRSSLSLNVALRATVNPICEQPHPHSGKDESDSKTVTQGKESLTSSVHVETILTSPSLTSLPSHSLLASASCSQDDSDHATTDPCSSTHVASLCASPTTVALTPRQEDELGQHLLLLDIG